MLRQRKYCRDKAPFLSILIIVTTEIRTIATIFFTIFFNNVTTEKLFVTTKLLLVAGCDIVLLAYLKLVATKIAAFSTFFFLLLFCLFSLLHQLIPTKHKVGEYSIIGHKHRSENVKNVQEKWIKNR